MHAVKIYNCSFIIVMGLQGREGVLGVLMAHRLAFVDLKIVEYYFDCCSDSLISLIPSRHCQQIPYKWDNEWNAVTNHQCNGHDRNAYKVTIVSVLQQQNPSYISDT